MKVVKIFVFILLGVGASESYGQTTFLSGYYVGHNHDTIRGLISARSPGANTRNCLFKSSATGKEQRLSPDDIAGYVIEEKLFYESHLIQDGAQKKHAFLKVVVRGRLSLLDRNGKLYVREPGKELFELGKGRRLSNGTVQSNIEGLQKLKLLMHDCAQIPGESIDEAFAAVQNDRITEIFKQYSLCGGTTPIVSGKTRIKSHVDFGIQANVMMTDVSVVLEKKTIHFGNKLVFGGGAFLSVFIPDAGDKFRLVLEAVYVRYKNYGSIHEAPVFNDVTIDYSMLRLPLLFRFEVGTKAFFEAGLHNQLLISQKTDWRVETTQPSTITTSYTPHDPLASFNVGALVGVGVKYRLGNFMMRSSLRGYFNQQGGDSNAQGGFTMKATYQTVEFVTALQF